MRSLSEKNTLGKGKKSLSYPSSYGLNSTTLALEGWLWHWITDKGWCAIRKKKETKPKKEIYTFMPICTCLLPRYGYILNHCTKICATWSRRIYSVISIRRGICPKVPVYSQFMILSRFSGGGSLDPWPIQSRYSQVITAVSIPHKKQTNKQTYLLRTEKTLFKPMSCFFPWLSSLSAMSVRRRGASGGVMVSKLG